MEISAIYFDDLKAKIQSQKLVPLAERKPIERAFLSNAIKAKIYYL